MIYDTETTCYLDGYEPQLARDVLAVVSELYDYEVVGVVLEIAAKVAQMEMEI
jgi:hypothetical protein